MNTLILAATGVAGWALVTDRRSLPGAFIGIAAAQLPCKLAVVITMAVLLSPVAWDHYWLLLFPAFLFVCDAGAPALLGRGGRVAFWTAAILTSGISRVTVGRQGWSIARDHSASTIAAIALFGALLALWQRLSSLAPQTLTARLDARYARDSTIGRRPPRE